MKARVHLSSEAVSGNSNKRKSIQLFLINFVDHGNYSDATPTACKESPV